MSVDPTSTAPFAVVTGASSGIGLSLATVFAQKGYHVLLCAEDEGVYTAAAQLTTDGLSAEALQADLATATGVEELLRAITSSGGTLDAIAINAGVGHGGAFVETSLEGDVELLELNVVGVVRLAKGVLPEMVQRGAGKVLFTSSVAATMPGPYYATYAASKAFVQSFAEAVRYEVKDSGVTVTALQPGPTDTNFFERADMEDTKAGQGSKDSPQQVALDAYEALMAGDDAVVAGSVKNKLQVAGAKVLPDSAKAAMHASLTKPQD